MVTFPYNTTYFAFTLDDVFLSFSTITPDTYFDLTVTIKYYEFFSDVEKTKVLEYKIPLFNLEQSYNVGRKIHRNLANIPGYNAESKFQYKTALVSFEAKEILIADSSVIDTITLNDVKFVAGSKPLLTANNIALLSNNTAIEKASLKGFFNVAFLLPAGDHSIEVYKNNSLESTEVIAATVLDNVYLKKITIADYSAKIGDVLKVKIKDTVILKEIVVDKEAETSNQIIFIDHFKLPRNMSFQGDYNYENKYTRTTHSYKRNLIEILEIIETEKLQYLNISTGFILKTQEETVESLVESTKAYLVFNDEVKLDLAPISKKINLKDSSIESFSYLVNFHINQSYA
jgi:hypothetical protein